MNVRLVWRLGSVLFVSVLASGVLGAQAPATPLYPPGDPTKEIAAAQAAAKKDGKHVLLDFGADWCPDCRVLGALLEDPAVASVVSANFHVVRVDVGRRDKNDDLVAKYGATSGDWIPAVVVLGPDATPIAATNDNVRLTRRTTREELVTILKSWAPKQRERELDVFVERGVRVVLRLERDRTGGRWLAAEFTPTATDTHLYAVDLPAEGVSGLGRPTRLSIVPGSGLRAIGPLSVDRVSVGDRIEELGVTLPIYPAGPVTLRLPIAQVAGARPGATRVHVSYMACGPRGCQPPVLDRRIAIEPR